jgi:trans-aconitate methyltransferase
MYSGDTKPTAANLDEQKARAEHLSTLIKRQVESLESHLDIGCSAGELLLGVRSKYQQVEPAGVELSEAHREWCREKGLRVYPTINEMRAEREGRFQLVSLSHVLEHMPDPVAFLKMLRAEVLLPDGYILIEVPNLFGHVSFEIAHLICFSEKTLKDALHKAGYQILSTKIHSIPRNYERGQRYITVIATPMSAEEMRPERIRYVWWRWLKLQRLKGLSGRTWTQLALHSPRIMTSLIRRAINGKD